MNQLVLSGTESLVPSGTASSCYRGPESGERLSRSIASGARNFSNLESFGFLLTESLFFAAVDSRPSAVGSAQ